MILHHILSWFANEYWSVSWPNIFAPSIWTLLGIGLAHWHTMHRHKKTTKSHNEQIKDLAGQIETLSDTLQAMAGEDG